MWWRSAAVFVAGGVLGTAFGVALGFFLFPYVFPPPPAAERLSEIERTSPVVAEGRSSTPTRAIPSTGARAA